MLIRNTRLAALPAAVLISLAFGCSDETAHGDKTGTSDDFQTDLAALSAALENPILSCQQERLTCRRDASSADERAACSATLADCLQTAADSAEKIAAAIRECRDEARECVSGAQGRSAANTCRSDYETCSQAAIDGAGNVDGAADGGSALLSVDAGVSEDDVSGSGRIPLPSLPSVDAGITDRLPKPIKCVVEMRQCVSSDLGAALSCADQARECLRSR